MRKPSLPGRHQGGWAVTVFSIFYFCFQSRSGVGREGSRHVNAGAVVRVWKALAPLDGGGLQRSNSRKWRGGINRANPNHLDVS